MSDTLIKLVGDNKIPQDVFSQLLKALDRAQSPKIREVFVDYDAISNTHLLDLIHATQLTCLAEYHVAFTDIDASFARNLLEAAIANRNIAHSWLLLGQHQFYYRDGAMGDVRNVLQLYHRPRCVTIECESIRDEQIDELAATLNGCQSQELTLTILNMSDAQASMLSEQLQKNSPFNKLHLHLGSISFTTDIKVEEDLIQQFSGLMSAVQSEVSEMTAATSYHASNLLNQGATWLSRFTQPLMACAAPSMDDDMQEGVREKAAIGKLA